MIIEKNKNIERQPFKIPQQFKSTKVNNFKLYDKNKYHDINNSNDMANKSLAILQERLDNGSISLDEFNKIAKSINKNRQ